MHPALIALVDDLDVGRPERFRNLTVVPLRSPPTGPNLVTLAEGLHDGAVEVTELNESGRVGTLRVINRGAFPVLLFDGELLNGAKQNRAVNTTIVVSPGTALEIPVSCVERGRWRRLSKGFRSAGRTLPSKLRRAKTQRVSHSLTTSGCYDADQHATWSEITSYSQERGVTSRTEALFDILEAERPRVDDYVRSIRRFRGQTGMAVYLSGRFAGIDLVGRPDCYKQLHARLLRSYAAEALSALAVNDQREQPKHRPDPQGTLRTVSTGEITQHTPPGAGNDLRISSDGLIAAALVDESGLIHLSVFPTAPGVH